jgi:hypothetical protein
MCMCKGQMLSWVIHVPRLHVHVVLHKVHTQFSQIKQRICQHVFKETGSYLWAFLPIFIVFIHEKHVYAYLMWLRYKCITHDDGQHSPFHDSITPRTPCFEILLTNSCWKQQCKGISWTWNFNRDLRKTWWVGCYHKQCFFKEYSWTGSHICIFYL